MKTYARIFLASATAVLIAGPALAETVTTKTVVRQEKIPGVNEINFMAFDTNQDNVLSMREVGEKLFSLFDQDGNGSIDNIEFTKKNVMTIIPMEKMTMTLVDYDDDGQAESRDYDYENFLRTSHLMRFDENKDGLSPADFIGKTIEELDDDQDKLVNKEEWKEAYMESLHLPVNEPERYQH